MSKFEGILNRLKKLEPSPDEIEQWPPKEGTISWALYKSLVDSGIEIPDKPPREPGLLFMIKNCARAMWE